MGASRRSLWVWAHLSMGQIGLLETNISTEPEAAALVDAAGELLSERGPAVAVAADSVGLNEAEQACAGLRS